MSRIDNRQLGLARLYGRAILEVAEERGEAEATLEELEGIAELLDRLPALSSFIASHLVDEDGRRRSLERIFRGRLSDLLVDALQVMNRKGRLALLPAVIEAYRQAHRDLRGVVDVEVTTAVPLSDALRRRLEGVAAAFTGRRPHLVEVVDPDILGGLILSAGDDKADASVRRELLVVARRLAERATTELLAGRSYIVET